MSRRAIRNTQVRRSPQEFVVGSVWLAVAWWCLDPAAVVHAVPSTPKDYVITFDATALEPPTFWQVPGVTPEMATYDPDSTDALRTEVKKELRLKPGNYWYGTFTFSFQFTVTQDGRLDFAKTLDQCVEGRGTQTLRVNCRRMYPYGGQRDY